MQIKPVVVTIDHIQQSLEATVVVEPALVLRLHEQPFFAHENSRQIRGSVRTARRTFGLEVIDLHLRGGVLIPSGLSPQRLAMATIAVGLTAEQLVAATSGSGIEVYVRSRLRGRQGQLV